MAHGDMGGASYLNPYPIMEPSFCDIVGVVNGTLDCARIDFDSLLLGGCWCHPCLEDLRAGGGRCVNYEKKGVHVRLRGHRPRGRPLPARRR